MKFFVLAVSFVFVTSGFGLSLQKTIPNDSIYGMVAVQDNMNQLIYKMLSPNLRNQVYPAGTDSSSVNTAIKGLKNLGVKDIEFFVNSQWSMLIKINNNNLTKIERLLIAILNEEGFMAQGKTLNANNRIIFSKNPELTGNNFYLRREGNYTLLSLHKEAFVAWKDRRIPVKLYKEATQKISTTKGIIGFVYDDTDHIYSSGSPSFITLSTKDNITSLDISVIRQNMILDKTIPTFFKDHPLFFSTSVEKLNTNKLDRLKTLATPLSAFFPSLRLALDIFLSPSANVKGLSFEFVNGDLVLINEKKYDSLDFALSFYFGDKTAAKDFFMSHFKASPIFKLSTETSKKQETFVLTPKIPNNEEMGFLPLYFVLDDKGFLTLTMNKQTMMTLAKSISNGKDKLIINDGNDYSLYVNLAEILDRFPIVNSLISQMGFDLKSIKEIEEIGDIKPYGKNTVEVQSKIILS